MVGAAMCLGLPRGPASIRWESERVGHEGTEGKGRGGGVTRHFAPAGLVLWPYIYLFSHSIFDALTSSVSSVKCLKWVVKLISLRTYKTLRDSALSIASLALRNKRKALESRKTNLSCSNSCRAFVFGCLYFNII